MSLTGTKGAPHHEERWTIDKGLTSEEVAAYVAKNHGYGNVAHPVGWNYGPIDGSLALFYQVQTQHSKVIGHHEHEARKEALAKKVLEAQSPHEDVVKPDVEPAIHLHEPVGEDQLLPDPILDDELHEDALGADDVSTSAPSNAPKTGWNP